MTVSDEMKPTPIGLLNAEYLKVVPYYETRRYTADDKENKRAGWIVTSLQRVWTGQALAGRGDAAFAFPTKKAAVEELNRIQKRVDDEKDATN